MGQLCVRNLRADGKSLFSRTASKTSPGVKLCSSMVIRERKMAAWSGGRWVAIWKRKTRLAETNREHLKPTETRWDQPRPTKTSQDKLRQVGTCWDQYFSPWCGLLQLLVVVFQHKSHQVVQLPIQQLEPEPPNLLCVCLWLLLTGWFLQVSHPSGLCWTLCQASELPSFCWEVLQWGEDKTRWITTVPQYHITTLLQCHSTTVPHYHITIVPQYYSTTLPHYYSTTVPQYHSTTVPQYYSTTVLQYHITTLLQYHSTTVLQYHITTVPHYHSTTVPHYYSTTLPQYHSTTVPHYHSTTVPQKLFVSLNSLPDKHFVKEGPSGNRKVWDFSPLLNCGLIFLVWHHGFCHLVFISFEQWAFLAKMVELWRVSWSLLYVFFSFFFNFTSFQRPTGHRVDLCLWCYVTLPELMCLTWGGGGGGGEWAHKEVVGGGRRCRRSTEVNSKKFLSVRAPHPHLLGLLPFAVCQDKGRGFIRCV